MARNEINKLNDRLVKAAKPSDNQYRLPDGRGLFLLVKPNGSKLWRLKFRYIPKGKDKRIEDVLSFGVYPEVSLKEAREKTNVAKKQIEQGIHPRKSEKEKSLKNYCLIKSYLKTLLKSGLKLMRPSGAPLTLLGLKPVSIRTYTLH
jgi:hypothetical protein